MVKRKRFLALGALMTALAAGIITVCIQYGPPAPVAR